MPRSRSGGWAQVELTGCSFKLAPKRRSRDTRMLFSLIYFFESFCINYIRHNYVIPQAMPHAIPQTYTVFYPHGYLRYHVKLNMWVI